MSKTLPIGVIIGNDNGKPGVRFACDTEETAERIREAYERSDADFERVVGKLVEQGRAEYVG